MIKKWLEHNYNLVVSVVICFIVVFYAFGCESKTRSVLHPAIKITRTELHLEAQEILNDYEQDVKRLEIGITDLDNQDVLKQRLIGFAIAVMETGNFDTMSLVTLLGSILAGGLFMDNRRKDTVIKTLKNNKQD